MSFATNKRSFGFTLIEVTLTIVIISVGLFGMMILFDNVTRGAMEGDMNITAAYLARDKLEQLMMDKVYKGYDYISTSSYPANDNVMVGSYNYIRQLSIYEVNKNDLTSVLAGSGFKRIDVTLKWGTANNQKWTESTLVTK